MAFLLHTTTTLLFYHININSTTTLTNHCANLLYYTIYTKKIFPTRTNNKKNHRSTTSIDIYFPTNKIIKSCYKKKNHYNNITKKR